MRKRNVGILACVAGIVMGLGISQLNVAGIFEKEPMKVYNSEERKIPESAKSKLKDEGKCWLCGSDDQSLMDYFRKFDDLGIICTRKFPNRFFRNRRGRMLFSYESDAGSWDVRSFRKFWR